MRRMTRHSWGGELRVIMAVEEIVNFSASKILFLFRKHFRRLPLLRNE